MHYVFVVCLILSAWLRGQVPQELPAGHPPVEAPTATEGQAPAPTPPANPQQEPARATQEPEAARDGSNRGGRGRRGGEAGQDGESGGEELGVVPEVKVPRRGIPVEDTLVETHCARCHARDQNGLMTRISYMRKAPEGWAESLKRMVRLHGLQISPADAKQIVRYLADRHGLTRSEAERSLYESERRVHWSEEHEDADFRQACSECHPLGRVLMQARDAEEWQQLRTTHVAMFPLARGSIGGGPPQDDEERMMFGGGQGGGSGQTTGGGGARGNRRGGNGASGATAQQSGGNQGGEGQGGRGNRGDRVLTWLAEQQPLFTPEWNAWAYNRREVPLAGEWMVAGREIGRGELFGSAQLTRVEDGEYEVAWTLKHADGTSVERKGRGLLYGGYSWRGRSTESGQNGRTWRETLLLDDRWNTLKGRFFTGDHDEIGVDVTLYRRGAVSRVFAIERPFVTVPADSQPLLVHGDAFPESIAASDFQLGLGVSVARVDRVSSSVVRLFVDVAPWTPCGTREVAYGKEPARAMFTLYDAVDYVRIRPTQGLARIGGIKFPKQSERFEAVAVHRGADEKPFTDDDVDLFPVKAVWSMREASVRDDDDDISFVGSIDPATGEFTPSVDGPNVQRKWSANNIGEVYVECRAELESPVRMEPAKPAETTPEKPSDKPADPPEQPAQADRAPDAPADAPADAPRGERPNRRESRRDEPAPVPFPVAAQSPGDDQKPTRGVPKMEARSFRARASLLVTVPQYMRWTRLEWEER